MELFIMIVIVYGISAIITISKIFEPLRDLTELRSPNFWKYLTSCMQCLPFWIGIFVAFVIGTPFTVNNDMFSKTLNVFFNYLFIGSFFSGTTMLIHTIFVKLKGDLWVKREEKERQRKIKKNILKKA